MMKRTPAARAVSVLLAVLVFFCPLVSRAETVITSFYPVWLIALNLTEGIDELDVVNLTESVGGCLHDYSLQPSDKVALSGADALLINGAGMESFLPVVLRDLPDLPVIDASQGIALLETDEEGEYAAISKTFAGGAPETLGDYNNIFMQLESGAVDAVVCDLSVAARQLAAKPDAFKQVEELNAETFGVGFKLGNEDMAKKVSTSLKEMYADGTVAKVLEKYADQAVSMDNWLLK